MDLDTLAILEAYCDGINDYVRNSKFFPLEFYYLGLSTFRPWTPADSISILKMITYHLSWNWEQDLIRELLSETELVDMVEELVPFT